MISKELLSEIIDDEVISFKVFNNEIDCFVGIESGEDIVDTYNIYELAHKCKEWAKTKGIQLRSALYINYCRKENAVCWIKNSESFNADIEPEAIFKACEWILKNE